ncbi:hypothetical protein [Marinomonas atlantica]|uniref:hypothetical protein n=1 Tax=Marinomonas atlantica TaxID=1806668 RepID=UPI00082F2A66|nr:hypothetical protein [Marinomonas atlantica]
MVKILLFTANIVQHLDIVSLGLKKIQHKTNDDRSLEYVVNACQTGKAFFFMSAGGGFVVLEPKATTPISVNVWLAFSEEGDAIQQYESEIVRLASEIDAERLTFQSPRKGYQRALAHWQRDGINYHRSVP